MKKKFLPLFKKTSTGAIQLWQIEVNGNKITTTHGQVDGKQQSVDDVVKEGKNAGRSNETTPAQQAMLEAEAKWLRQKKRGYVETALGAAKGATDAIIEGGVIPMLAKVYEDCAEKLSYPVAVQPKLDGHRCVAVIDEDGEVTLWTRTRKRYTAVPHIEEAVAAMVKKMKLRSCVIDGELYNHKLKSDFEKISSMVRQKEPHPDCPKFIEYHVYDIVSDAGFKERLGMLADVVLFGGKHVHLVDTHFAETEAEVMKHYETFQKDGYEGAMVRALGMGYENKRSKQLLKLKDFQDAEFKILRLEEGRGKLMGHAGACVCALPDGREFNAKMAGNTDALKKAWENPKLWVGKLLTVKFQNYTSAGVPRFPVGMRLRGDE